MSLTRKRIVVIQTGYGRPTIQTLGILGQLFVNKKELGPSPFPDTESLRTNLQYHEVPKETVEKVLGAEFENRLYFRKE